jgi:hypothetical protein
LHFLIGPLIVCYILAVPALRNVAFVLLGLAALAIGPIWSHRALGAIALSAAPLLAVVLSASAQTDQQIEWCNGEDNATRELSLSGCTAMIQSSAYVDFFAGPVTEGGIAVGRGLIRTADRLPAAGTQVTVAVRPEKVQLRRLGSPEATENSLAARVTEIVYAGAVSTFILEDSSGAEIKLLTQNHEAAAAAPGESVMLVWSPAHTALVSD